MRDRNDQDECETMKSGDCGPGLRNRFFRGKAAGAEELRIEQRYHIERRRLLSRAVVGDGVVCGFALTLPTQERGPLGIGEGLALDCHGAEIFNARDLELRPGDAVILAKESNNCLRVASDQKVTAGSWLLSVHYAERDLDRVTMRGGCECPKEEFRYLCETLVFSLRRWDECGMPCGEEECVGCTCAEAVCGDGGRIARHCQCEAAKRIPGCGPLPERRKCSEWQGLHFDAYAGVPLARVTIEVDPEGTCDPARFGEIVDDCGPRRLVKTNKRLYDLIRGCDLTRIAKIGWQELLDASSQDAKGHVLWRKFANMFTPPATVAVAPPAAEQSEHSDTPPEPCPTKFTVHFSKPVQTRTLRPEAFVITGIIQERGTGWLDVRRVPIFRIDSTPDIEPPANPPPLTDYARIVVDLGWYGDEISNQAKDSWFEGEPTQIEIEIRGDLILDCNGIAIDANARGLAGVPTGNGTPGGTFVSAFTVAEKTWPRNTP